MSTDFCIYSIQPHPMSCGHMVFKSMFTIPFCRALAFSFPSALSFLLSMNHAPIPADITSLFCDPSLMHSYSMCVRLNSILTVISLTRTCFLGSLPRSSVVGATSDVSFLNPGALLTLNLLQFECWEHDYSFFLDCWWWGWCFLPICCDHEKGWPSRPITWPDSMLLCGATFDKCSRVLQLF